MNEHTKGGGDYSTQDIDTQSITTIRMLSVDAVEAAQSGHPGLPLGAAPMAYTLWRNWYRHAPSDPHWINRDRFVLSAGHGSMLQYALLHLSGYDLSLDEIKRFRQWGSRATGHPKYQKAPGVETSTGPLGQGFANGVGIAMAEKFLAQTFNTPAHQIIDYRTYGIVSDGDLMEGVSAEAASIAGNLGLGKLVYLYDSNDITIEGSTSLTFCEDVAKRFDAYHWHVAYVEDGNHLEMINAALRQAHDDPRPSLIIVRTHIGYGSPKADSEAVHGAPLGSEARAQTRAFYGWPDEDFFVPDAVREHMLSARVRGDELKGRWQERFAAYEAAEPEKSRALLDALQGKLPDGWDAELPTFAPDDGPVATRTASGKVMQLFAARIPTFLGGSADLGSSNKTLLKDEASWSCNAEKAGRNLHFGVREHAMAGIVNGMALSNQTIPYAATFFIFTDYMRGAMRLSALMGLRVVYVLSHDSIGQGEDGSTHQPIEHLASFRAMPNMHVMRPADANETVHAWRYALAREEGPTLLVLTRQDVPVIDRERYAPAFQTEFGAYVLNPEVADPEAIVIATGSEVSLAVEAAEQMEQEGKRIRVVSMPCWEAFAARPLEYQHKILPPSVTKRVGVEAGSSFGWERYLGSSGHMIAIDTFGSSAPGPVLMEQFGFTVERIVAALNDQLRE